MGRIQKKGKAGNAAQYLTRNAAIKKLQLRLSEFRRLCILKGIHPREPKKKVKGANKTYYHVKDINFLLHEPLLDTFRGLRAHERKVRRARAKQNAALAARLMAHKPHYKLDHLVKERYPSFIDALRDLDDPLTLVHLFATLPAERRHAIPAKAVETARRLALEWQAYVVRCAALRKVFVSVKGFYYQAEVAGQPITWLVPHQLAQVLPTDVDYRIMLTFLEFYSTLLQFINFKLYHSLGLRYPPLLDPRLEQAAEGLAAVMKELAGLREDAAAQAAAAAASTSAAAAANGAGEPGAVDAAGGGQQQDKRPFALTGSLRDKLAAGERLQKGKGMATAGGRQQRSGKAGAEESSEEEEEEEASDIEEEGSEEQGSDGADGEPVLDIDSGDDEDDENDDDKDEDEDDDDEEEEEEEEAAGALAIRGSGMAGAADADGDDNDDDDSHGAAAERSASDGAQLAGGALAVAPDDEAAICASLFRGLVVFLAREVPREPLMLVVRAFGGVVAWDGEGSPYKEGDEAITHQLVDRPTQGHRFLSRAYVQPQWAFDSANFRVLLPVDLYVPGKTPPPHLSPFVKAEEEGYTPDIALTFGKLRDAADAARRRAAGELQAGEGAFVGEAEAGGQAAAALGGAGGGRPQAAASAAEAEKAYLSDLAKELRQQEKERQAAAAGTGSASEQEEEEEAGEDEEEEEEVAAAKKGKGLTGRKRGAAAAELEVDEAQAMKDIMMTRKTKKLYERMQRARQGKQERVDVLEARKAALSQKQPEAVPAAAAAAKAAKATGTRSSGRRK